MRGILMGFCMFGVAALGSAAIADSVVVKTPAPVIYLADNLDEADGLGWCIDTVGRGLSDKLHAHSCKPQGGDVQFDYDATSGMIRSVAFEGKCMQMNAADAATQFGLLDCDTSNAGQKFVLNETSGAISPADAPDSCVAVGESSRSAGPFMSRDLLLAACDSVAASHRTWVHLP